VGSKAREDEEEEKEPLVPAPKTETSEIGGEKVL